MAVNPFERALTLEESSAVQEQEARERVDEADAGISPEEVLAMRNDRTRDISEHLKSQQRETRVREIQLEAARELANQDPLTRLLNRKGFDSALTGAIDRLRGGGEGAPPAVSVIMVDIDHFKRVNDTYGHATGDLVIAKVAEILRGSVRATDPIIHGRATERAPDAGSDLEVERLRGSAARVGGEEFVVLLEGASLDVAAAHAERIRQKIEATTFTAVSSDQSFQKTVSLGVTSFHKDDPQESAGGFLARADKALYSAKNGGRNQVVTSP